MVVCQSAWGHGHLILFKYVTYLSLCDDEGWLRDIQAYGDVTDEGLDFQ